MIVGHVRDLFPRIALSLPGIHGPISIEFIVDTGFDGELSLPPSVVSQIEALFIGDRGILLAGLHLRDAAHFLVETAWHGEQRRTEIVELDGRPLLGGALLQGSLVTIEHSDGGEVTVEQL